MVYFTTDDKRLRTENHKLTTGLRGLLFRSANVSQKFNGEEVHSRAWIRLASVLKSETPCNS